MAHQGFRALLYSENHITSVSQLKPNRVVVEVAAVDSYATKHAVSGEQFSGRSLKRYVFCAEAWDHPQSGY